MKYLPDERVVDNMSSMPGAATHVEHLIQTKM